MNQYPPGEYVSRAKQTLPAPGPDQPLRTVEIDAGPLWGIYRITFIAKQNPRRGMRNWFWTMESGERIDLGQPTPAASVGDFVVSGVHGADAGTPEPAAVSSNQPKPPPGSVVKISELIAALEAIKADHGDLVVAEAKPLGYMAIQHVEVETLRVPKNEAFAGVVDGQLVVLITAQ